MALHIRDAETDRLVRLLAERKGVPLTEAIKVAVRNELERDEDRPGPARPMGTVEASARTGGRAAVHGP